jgi:TonB family protein
MSEVSSCLGDDMSTAVTPELSPVTESKRKVPRYKLTVPLDLTVLRSGVPDSIPGHSIEIGEGGMGVVAASRLLVGEPVRVEFFVPHTSTPVRATAVVRYQREQCFGLQFLRLPDEQQSLIRYWTRREGEVLLFSQPGAASGEAAAQPELLPGFDSFEKPKRRFGFRRLVAFAVFIMALAALLGWWQWQRGWRELEAQVPAREAAVAQPQLKVPGREMQQRIVYQVPPEYPESARQARVQGTVVLDTVVNPDGAVAQMKVVSGPEILSQAAMDAVRWWRYEPYLVNGRPATVETTVAIDF